MLTADCYIISIYHFHHLYKCKYIKFLQIKQITMRIYLDFNILKSPYIRLLLASLFLYNYILFIYDERNILNATKTKFFFYFSYPFLYNSMRKFSFCDIFLMFFFILCSIFHFPFLFCNYFCLVSMLLVIILLL